MKKFEELNSEELWQLRSQIRLNSLYVADYANGFGYTAHCMSVFFDGYYEHLWEIGEEQGFSTHDQVMTLDSEDELWAWFGCFEDFSWVEYEDAEEEAA